MAIMVLGLKRGSILTHTPLYLARSLSSSQTPLKVTFQEEAGQGPDLCKCLSLVHLRALLFPYPNISHSVVQTPTLISLTGYTLLVNKEYMCSFHPF